MANFQLSRTSVRLAQPLAEGLWAGGAGLGPRAAPQEQEPPPAPHLGPLQPGPEPPRDPSGPTPRAAARSGASPRPQPRGKGVPRGDHYHLLHRPTPPAAGPAWPRSPEPQGAGRGAAGPWRGRVPVSPGVRCPPGPGWAGATSPLPLPPPLAGLRSPALAAAAPAPPFPGWGWHRARPHAAPGLIANRPRTRARTHGPGGNAERPGPSP